MVHHTASGAGSDGQADVNYCCYGSADEPLANLYLNRAGKVWVMAAGATNTNGSGHDSWGGGVPDDSMNTHAIGIEAANNGTGEVWPQAQQEAYAKLVQALQDAYLIGTNNVREHAEWAPGRKIDPAGPSRWASSGTWNGNNFRNDMAAGWPGGSTPPPTRIATAAIVEDSMHYYIKPSNEPSSTTVWVSDGTSKWAMHSSTQLRTDQDLQLVRLVGAGMDPDVAQGFAYDQFTIEQAAWRAYGFNIDPTMTGRDPWGWKA